MKKILALVLALCLALSVCSFAAAEEKAPFKVGVLVPVMTHGWVSGITYFAQNYAEQLKDQGIIDYKLVTCSGAEEMTAQIDEMKLWGAQALVIAPQWTGMELPVQGAIDDGIVVVAFDMDIDAEGIYKVTGDNESMGIAGAKYIVDKIGTEGTVIAMSVPSAGSVNELRMKGFMDTIAEIAPNITVIEKANEAFTKEQGLSVMADVLTAEAKIDAVYSLDDETSIGAIQAITEAGREDIKAITGGGGCQEYFAVIAECGEKLAASSALYSPMMIEDCFDLVIEVLNGKEVEAVKVIPTTIVDITNVQEFLDPENTIY